MKGGGAREKKREVHLTISLSDPEWTKTTVSITVDGMFNQCLRETEVNRTYGIHKNL